MQLQGSELEMIILRIRCTHGQKLFSLCMKTYNQYKEKLIFKVQSPVSMLALEL